jgi:hypothetical protein
VARLANLEHLRLAERVSGNSWELAAGWSGHLKEMGTRNDILKQMHAAVRGDPSRYRIVRPGEELEGPHTEGRAVAHGRIAAKGLADEVAGTYYAVLESPTGTAYHVPIDRRAAETLRVGDFVALETEPGRGAAVRKEALSIEAQVHHPGPVPLDRMERRALAPYGFGATVDGALQRRATVLQRLGLEPNDPQLPAKLREVERQALGGRFASSSGQIFVRDTPSSFQGRVQSVECGADGTSYAVVADGRRFVMVQADRDLRAREGNVITLRRGRDGRLHAHDTDKDRDRG